MTDITFNLAPTATADFTFETGTTSGAATTDPAGLVLSHDWRSFDDGAVSASTTANGEGTLGAAAWTDVHDIAPGFVQDLHVVDGAVRLRATTPTNVVGLWTITDYTATADTVRAGFLHAGFLDASVDAECDANASMDIVLVDDAGTGYVCHFLNVYEGGALVGKVKIGRDTAGAFSEDEVTVMARPFREGDRCEFSVDRASPNNLIAYLNGDEVASHTESAHDLRTFTRFSLPTNSAATSSKWRPGYYAQWVTTGGAWVPEVGWANLAAAGGGTGDVVGPASSAADSLARFDGTTGKLLKNGAVIGTDVQAYSSILAGLVSNGTPGATGLSLLLNATAAAARSTLATGGVIGGQDEQTGPLNTATETSLLTSTITTTAAAGDVLRITAAGTTVQNSGGSLAPTLRLKIGGTTVLSWSGSLSNSATQREWEMTATIRVKATSDANCSGTCVVRDAVFVTDHATYAGDLSGGQALDVTWQHGSATATQSCDLAYITVERVRPI